MTKHIEFDRAALEVALQDGLNLNDCGVSDINKLLLESEKEIIEEVKYEDGILDTNVLGGKFKIGTLDFDVVLGNFTLLNIIESPLVTELKEGDEISFTDCCEALYVLYKGEEVLEPIQNIQQRIKDMLILKPLIKSDPSLMNSLMDRVEAISKSRLNFSKAAREFYMLHFSKEELQNVTEQMVTMLNCSLTSLSGIEAELEETKKKITQVDLVSNL